MKRLHVPSNRRGAFTLVELLVVMALIVLLATLMIGFFPSVTTSAREARAAMLLQSWLNIAKQRALRDQTPTGLRLLVLPGTSQVIECQYISQPEDFCSGKIRSDTTFPAQLDKVSFVFSGIGLVDLINGYVPISTTDMPFWAVQPGDFLEVSGTGLIYRIKSVDAPDKVTITPPLPNRITTLSSYRILRGSRALGDEPLKLPGNNVLDLKLPANNVNNLNITTFIDINTNVTYVNTLPRNSAGDIDILFAPSGQVITRGVSTDKIHLWVRTINIDDSTNIFRGDPTLVSIFVRTGFVGAFSPDPIGPNPYSLVK